MVNTLIIINHIKYIVAFIVTTNIYYTIFMLLINFFFGLIGVNRVCDNLQYMLGFRPNIFWKICWAGICPVVLLALFIVYCIQFEPPMYGCYNYPDWGHGIGWALLLISVIQIPIFAVGYLIYYGLKGDIKGAFRPTAAWGPNDGTLTKQISHIDLTVPVSFYPYNGTTQADAPVYVLHVKRLQSS
ncbi:Solute carrier 6 [Chamberlinius hualienensis]